MNGVVDVALLYGFPEALHIQRLGLELRFVGVLAPVPRLQLPGAGPVGGGLRFAPFELFALRREAEGVERVGGGLFHSSRRGRRLCLGGSHGRLPQTGLPGGVVWVWSGGSLGGLWGPVEPGMSLLWLLRRAALCLLVSYMPLARLPRAKKGLAALLKHHLASQIWVSD